MLVRRLVCLCAATSLVGLASVAFAENGVLNNSMLTAMGLPGIEVMTDSQSMTIRGRGYGGYGGSYYNGKPTAIAYGGSYAKVATHGAKAGSYDGFYADGRYYASGAHGSIAGVVIKKSRGPHGGGWYNNYGGGGGYYPPSPPKSKKIVAFSGGFAFAHTK